MGVVAHWAADRGGEAPVAEAAGPPERYRLDDDDSPWGSALAVDERAPAVTDDALGEAD